ncbi:MAG: hypothetical protein IJR52_01150 [Selenomonadaceae bacterium]|nr:hypothetical protein [Selenomonadaceae bacterium]MBQ9496162.1 hypothetical protein [Selenomonadaceae bacterium]
MSKRHFCKSNGLSDSDIASEKFSARRKNFRPLKKFPLAEKISARRKNFRPLKKFSPAEKIFVH